MILSERPMLRIKKSKLLIWRPQKAKTDRMYAVTGPVQKEDIMQPTAPKQPATIKQAK